MLALKPFESSFLASVESHLQDVFDTRYQTINESVGVLLRASQHLCMAEGAKRVRPLLMLYFGESLGVKGNVLEKAALAVELMHSASLLHDDVIDDADLRRNRSTVNRVYSNSVSVLAGNYLLAKAFRYLEDYPVQVTKDAVRGIGELTEGAMFELEMRGKLEFTLEDWRAMALGKTSSLFAWCGKAAATIAERPDLYETLAACGNHIGLLFQMVDDLRDLKDKASLKDRFLDIQNREPSFPVLYAAINNAEIREKIRQVWAEETVDIGRAVGLGEEIVREGGYQGTVDAIVKECGQIRGILSKLDPSDGSDRILAWVANLQKEVESGFRQ